MSSFNITRRKVTSFAAVAALGSLPWPATSQSKPDRLTIRYGYLPVPTVPLYAAIAHDLFEKENLDVQLVKFTSGPATFQAMQAGSVDAGQGGIGTYFMGTTRGLEIRWVYTYGDYSPIEGLVVKKGSAVRDFKDLKGKKVTYASGSSQHLAHLIALRKAGMNISDVDAVPLAPPQGLAAVLNGDVEAGWFWDPFVSQAIDKGATRIINNKELGALDPFGFAVTTKFLSDPKNVAGIGRMIRAMAEGQRRFAADPGPTMEKIRTITGIDDKLAQQIIKGVEWYEPQAQLDVRHPLSLAEPNNFGRGASQYLKDRVEDPAILAQLITKRGDIAAFIDNRPLNAAFVR
ncbi:MAG: NrtA/SsuA/CpmA family ABC transporter substrate-binding protein [Burkholderiales bacterium]|nr:NrtA/SsuA/CpmA family ABC transporter substrate-binding protein [Burkholderiales bacterium]